MRTFPRNPLGMVRIGLLMQGPDDRERQATSNEIVMNPNFWEQLRVALEARQIGHGLGLLNAAHDQVVQIGPGECSAPGQLLALAEWTDAGNWHPELLPELLARIPL